LFNYFFRAWLKNFLDYYGEYSYFPISPKSHVPVGVRRSSMWWENR